MDKQLILTKQDILNVASSIGKNPTEQEIEWVLSNYNDYEADNPESSWIEIVEDMLYQLENESLEQ